MEILYFLYQLFIYQHFLSEDIFFFKDSSKPRDTSDSVPEEKVPHTPETEGPATNKEGASALWAERIHVALI